MPILYVNPAGSRRRTVRVSGSAKVNPTRKYAGAPGPSRYGRNRSKARRIKPTMYGPARKTMSNPSRRSRQRIQGWRNDPGNPQWAANRQGVRDLDSDYREGSGRKRYSNPAKRRKRKVTDMAKRRKRNKSGRFTKRRRRSRRSAARLGMRRRKRYGTGAFKKRRRRRRKAAAAPKRRRRRRRNPAPVENPPKRRRRRAKRGRRRVKYSRARRRRAGRKGARRRKKHGTGNYKHRMRRGAAGPVYRKSRVGRGRRRTSKRGTVIGYAPNPSRRRRRRRRGSSRRRRRSSRRIHRRYRRNPSFGGGIVKTLIGLAKRALPVVLSFYGARMIAQKVAPYIPGISSLGMAASPLVAVGTVALAHVATNKVSFLRKHKTEIMLGTAINALDAVFRAVAPQGIKDAIGMGEYVGVDTMSRGLSEYVGVGATPLDDDIALNGYIQVSGDGVEEGLGVDEELGLEEELGVEEELGDSWDAGGLPGGGLSQSAFQRRVPTQAFAKQIPARSFAKQIPAATGQFDNPQGLYVGIFGGGFGN